MAYEDLDWSAEAISDAFSIPVSELPSAEDMLVCSFDSSGYEEWCYVLFVKDGELWEVEASHCSCNDFGGCWEPTRTVWAAVLTRQFNNDPALGAKVRAAAEARGVRIGEA